MKKLCIVLFIGMFFIVGCAGLTIDCKVNPMQAGCEEWNEWNTGGDAAPAPSPAPAPEPSPEPSPEPEPEGCPNGGVEPSGPNHIS
jgi:hypothetical protein